MPKLGSKKHPAVVRVNTMEKAEEIMNFCHKNGWQVIVGIEPDAKEDISDFEKLMNPPQPIISAITNGRNDPCSCGSGKKYKKCCLTM